MTGKLVVLDADELRKLVTEAVADALRSASSAGDDWVDAKSSPLEPRAFKRLAAEGAFPTFRAGKRLLAKRSDVDAWIASRPRRAPVDVDDPAARALAAGHLRVVGGRKR